MGMYTELHLNARLLETTPPEVLDILRYMVGETSVIPKMTPEHPLFSTERWGFMLRCDSYYFAADTHSTLRYDDIAKTNFLCVRTNLKNYDQEIERFVDWITPYLDEFDGEFLGFMRYEIDVPGRNADQK